MNARATVISRNVADEKLRMLKDLVARRGAVSKNDLVRKGGHVKKRVSAEVRTNSALVRTEGCPARIIYASSAITRAF